MFEHGFLLLVNDHSFMHPHPPPPPPPDNDRISHAALMIAFPEEKISHYTTVYI